MDFTQLKQLFTDEDAVSPVIGVILMVAITVILAAVIGTFVLGLGENVQDSAPQANFQFEYENLSDGTDDNDAVIVTHTGGEDVTTSTVTINIGGDALYTNSALDTTNFADLVDDGDSWGSAISTGSAQQIQEDGTDYFGAGEDVRVIWTSPSGSQSQTIGQSQVPS